MAARFPAATSAGPEPCKSHDSFQRVQAFIDAGGCRGLQEEVLLSGAWNLNPWFVSVELIFCSPRSRSVTVGVVVSYVGMASTSTSPAHGFSHGGDLVERGRTSGVGVEPLLPGKHPVNTRAMKVELVPTTNIVLNWADRSGGAHAYDAGLSSICVRSHDGFSFTLDVAAIIHIGMNTTLHG